jgi:hypothetical protein
MKVALQSKTKFHTCREDFSPLLKRDRYYTLTDVLRVLELEELMWVQTTKVSKQA